MSDKNTRQHQEDVSLFDAITSITYLIWVIAKQQWRLLIFLMVCSVLLLPAPRLFFSMVEEFKLAGGLIASFAILPSLLILLVFLPVVAKQVSSSSINKRVKASGMRGWVVSISTMVIFTLIALVAYYIMITISVIIFSNTQYEHYDAIWVIWSADLNWLALITIVPISFYGLSTLGIFLGWIKMNDIPKGIIVFLLILFLLIFSRTLISPLDFYDPSVSDADSMLKKLTELDNKMLYFNPWGAMVFGAEYGMLNDLLLSISITRVDNYDFESDMTGQIIKLLEATPYIKLWPTFLYSTMWTTIFTSIIIFKGRN